MEPPPQEERAEGHRRLLALALASCEAAYKEHISVWQTIETKAQHLSTISGVLIAGTMALVSKGDLESLGVSGVFAVVIAMMLICATILLALITLYLRPVLLPPVGKSLAEEVEEIIGQDPNNLEERECRLLTGRVKLWCEVVEELGSRNQRKADLVRVGQGLIMVSCVLFASIIVKYVLER